MPQLAYLEFDLTIRAGGERYSASVTGCLEQPFADELQRFYALIGPARTRKAESPELSIVKSFGGKLFQSVFPGQLLTRLRASLDG